MGVAWRRVFTRNSYSMTLRYPILILFPLLMSSISILDGSRSALSIRQTTYFPQCATVSESNENRTSLILRTLAMGAVHI